MSRLSSDLSVVDQLLGRFIDNIFQLFVTVLALMILIAILVPPVLIAVFVAFLCLAVLNVAVDRANRVIKREANRRMSPIQTLLKEGVIGRPTIRAHRSANLFVQRFAEAEYSWVMASYWSVSLQNFGMMVSCVVSFVVSFCTAVIVVLERESLQPSVAGLAVTYSFVLPYCKFDA
jgi:ABC-type multidrug transport system fused ATPase/permease subunit